MAAFEELKIDGRVATPSDPDWDEARLAWNLVADQRPEAVVFAESAADVAATIRFAADRDLRVAGQGTGHGAAALTALDGTILLKTERMREIEVDAGARTARVEAGVLSMELGAAAGAHGLCFLPGSAIDVGVVGYTLGGGLSWLGRRHGFACNNVRAIELVTAAGEPVTVGADSEPDLFWALRGGGGGYAIVTALQLDLLPIAEVYAGALLFPAEAGAEGVRIYRDWAETVSEDVTSVVRFLRPPPMPDVPEPIRDRPLLTIDAACIGGREEGEATIAPLREIGEPIMDTFDQIPTAGLGKIHMDPEQPVPAARRGRRRPREDRRGLRHARHRVADDAGAGRGGRGPPGPHAGGDGPLGHRGRLLQLRRAPLRRRRDPPRRDLLPPRRGQAPLRPREPDRRQPRGLPGSGLSQNCAVVSPEFAAIVV
jgi:FAD/FMN-containing dehydrogenase